MPAHLRPITEKCQHPGCGRFATQALYNTYNARIGSYCAPHAEQALREFQERTGERP